MVGARRAAAAQVRLTGSTRWFLQIVWLKGDFATASVPTLPVRSLQSIWTSSFSAKWNVRDFKWMSSKPSSKVFLFVSKRGKEVRFDNV
jgi:hypothetical protein